jgi:hypothetical protein
LNLFIPMQRSCYKKQSCLSLIYGVFRLISRKLFSEGILKQPGCALPLAPCRLFDIKFAKYSI